VENVNGRRRRHQGVVYFAPATGLEAKRES